MRVDSHQHFWLYDPQEYGWIQDHMSVLRRDFLPGDLEPLLDRFDLDGSVAVQARQSLEETRWLLELARDAGRILGVVGWVDLRSPRVDEHLEEFADEALLKGVRHIVQDEPDDRFVMRDDFRRGIGRLREYDLVYDLLTYPKQLAAACELVEAHPGQPFVLDHVSKPDIKAGGTEGWAENIRRLARSENVACKVSGMVTEAAWHGWSHDTFFEYLDVVCDAFGPERLMFGSDWPVCLLSSEYASAYGVALAWARRLSEDEQEQVFGGTAVRIYDLHV